MRTKIKLRINSDALAKVIGVRPASVVDVECKNDIPINREWRNRIKDSVIDNCVTVIETKKKRGDK